MIELRLIHFARQSEFVNLGGTPVVEHIFALDQLHRLHAWLAERHGLTVTEGDRLNLSHRPKPWFRKMQPLVSTAARTALPASVRRAIYPLWLKSGLFERAAQGYREIDLGADVERFVAERYAVDAALHRTALVNDDRDPGLDSPAVRGATM